MRRLFWVAVGATAGIVVAHKIRRTAQRISPPAVSTSVAQAFSGMRRDIRDFTKDVRFAMALPWAFRRLGMDPAFGSGPLATVLQDLLSILIYFVIAMAIIPQCPPMPGNETTLRC